MKEINDNLSKSLTSKQINDLTEFINKMFIHKNDKVSYFKNYKTLLEYLNSNNYSINELDAEVLFSKSCELKPMIKCILDEKISVNDLIKPLVNTYKSDFNDDLFNNNPDYINLNNDIDSLDIYFNEVKKYRVLSRDEEVILFNRYKQGDMSAYEKLIKHNLRLAIKVCKDSYNSNIEYSDLIQECNLILMKVLNKFDINQGYKFSTYFMSCAKWHLDRVVKNKSRIVRLPVHIYDDVIKLKKAMDLYSDYTDGMNKIDKVKYLSSITNIDENRIYELEKYLYDVDSFDKKISDENDDTIGIFIVDEDCCVENEVIDKLNILGLREFLKNNTILSDIEKDVLYYRYVHRMKLAEIGNIMGVERETIRLREKKAFEKLKKNKVFRSYVPCEYLELENKPVVKKRINRV